MEANDDFNIGKFSKLLSDFKMSLSIQKINEIFNTIVAKERIQKKNKDLSFENTKTIEKQSL